MTGHLPPAGEAAVPATPAGTLLRYARLWRRFVITAAIREAEYRVNFALSVVEGLIQLGLAVVGFLIIYRYTGTVAGWTRPQVLLLVGIYRVVEGLINLQIAPNMVAVAGYIRDGEMDFLLLRPVSSQFLASLRTLALPEIGNVVVGVALTLYAGTLAGVRWTPGGVAAAGAFLLCGVLLVYALWLGIVTWSFWLVRVDNLATLFYSVFGAARYPVSYFKGVVRALLTFALPVAFATTFPAEALLGRGDLRLLPVGVLLAALALVASSLFWRYAVRHYSSASS